jgi:hypothetical protein
MRHAYGPFLVDAGRQRIMSSATGFQQTETSHIRQSELCATCHTLFTHSITADGSAGAELPEQVPYLEWLQSDYRDSLSCQACHMPVISEPTPIASVLGQPREGAARHDFRGGNFFMPRLLDAHRAELAVAATPAELQAASDRAVAHLQGGGIGVRVEEVRREAGRLDATVTVENHAGHKMPTAYPSRRAWLHVVVRDARGTVVFESGRLGQDGAIAGNDGDHDAARYEPHYATITSPDEVQVYESVMVDAAGRVTTGLLTGVRYVKDNRLLPAGFDKGRAPADVAVHGAAASDADFLGGSDRVKYEVNVGDRPGPFSVDAELVYQPIGFRWAQNLRTYDAAEPGRFVRYYDAAASTSAVVVAKASGAAR